MNPDELRAFVAIVETGRLVSAARRNGMAAASVTRRLQSLEAELGVTLIDRTPSRLEVTRWGRDFYPHALAVLDALSRASEAVRTLKEGVAGPLRVVSPSAFGRAFVAAHLPAFLARYPDVDVSMLLDNRRSTLAETQADIAFIVGGAPDGDERIRPLGSARFLLVGAPGYLASLGPIEQPADLIRARFVSVSRHTGVERLRLERASEIAELDVRSSVSAYDPLVVSDLVRAGAGIAVLSEPFCRGDIRSGGLAEVLPGWCVGASQTYAMLFTASAASLPRVRVFIDYFAAILTPVFSNSY